jgi:hypothetical protein
MASGGTEFTAQLYKDAAIERMDALRGLYDVGQYVLGLYTAGVAVESMLGAYRVKVDSEFSSRHDLRELAKESKLGAIVPQKSIGVYAASLGVIAARWSNNHRYRTAAAALRKLKQSGLDRGIKGDALKENARRAINAAIELVNIGDQLWKKSSKN